MGKISTARTLICTMLVIGTASVASTGAVKIGPHIIGKTITMQPLWEKLVHRLTLEHPQMNEDWEIWYIDTFDRDFPPMVDARGRGLIEGLTQLWAKHMFETVRPNGQGGFSSFYLKWKQGRVDIDGDREGAKRLRGWLFGKKEYSYKGVAAEADPALLKTIAVAHSHLIESKRKAAEILAIARAAKDASDFTDRLNDLIKK